MLRRAGIPSRQRLCWHKKNGRPYLTTCLMDMGARSVRVSGHKASECDQ